MTSCKVYKNTLCWFDFIAFLCVHVCHITMPKVFGPHVQGHRLPWRNAGREISSRCKAFMKDINASFFITTPRWNHNSCNLGNPSTDVWQLSVGQTASISVYLENVWAKSSYFFGHCFNAEIVNLTKANHKLNSRCFQDSISQPAQPWLLSIMLCFCNGDLVYPASIWLCLSFKLNGMCTQDVIYR